MRKLHEKSARARTRPGRVVGAPAGRIIALDLARLLAIVGMMSQHLLGEEAPDAVVVASTGFPSTLFAVLGGVSAVVSTRRYRGDGRSREAAASVFTRGAVVALIGILLLAAPTYVVVVLLSYGIALMLTALLLQVSSAVLLGLVVALALGGPQLLAGAHEVDPATGPAVAVLRAVFLGGTYPVVTWFTFMLIGVLVGRVVLSPLPRRRAAGGLAASGAVMFLAGSAADLLSRPAVIAALQGPQTPWSEAARLATTQSSGYPPGPGWIALLNGVAHSGSTADILRTSGAAIAVIAILLATTARVGDPQPLLLRPFVQAGAAPLTIYTLHVLVTTIAVLVAGETLRTDPTWWQLGPLAFAAHLLGALLLGTLLSALHRRGPLEALVSAIAHRGARLATRTRRSAITGGAHR